MIPKNKNISILHPYVNKRGGAVNMMIYLSNLLSREGNNVVFYTFDYDKKLFSKQINFEIVVSNKVSIAKKIKNSDYIIIGNSPMQFVGVISKVFFFSNAKLIWWHHHYPWYYNKDTNFLILIKRYFEKLSLRFIDKVIVNSEYLKSVLKKTYGLDAEILYPVLDKDFLKTCSIKKDFSNNVIFSYGRWVKGKNIEQIFDTYIYIKDKNPNIKLLLGGIGEELDFFKEKYKKDKNVTFLGLLDSKSIIKNFEKTLVFLFPSKIDSFGITIIEALSQGVPVVAFNLNGAKEIIKTNENGFLVNTNDEFSQKTYLLINDVQLNKDISKNTIKVSLNYTEQNFKKQLSKIF